MKRILTIGSAFALSACASSNTGEISYRRASPPVDLTTAATAYEANCPGDWGTSGTSSGRTCTLMLGARLDRQNVGFGTPIPSGRVYSLRLDHGMIAEVSEAGFGRRDYGGVPNPFSGKAEIVVLANVFEFGEENPRFLDPTDVTTARVIYFSEDVARYQDLNFSNIPLQAPVAYSGNPVGIQLIVLELDRTSGPAQSLLRRLAELGTSTGLVPGGPVSETLLSLGSSLLQQNTDDMIFEYRMVLDPGNSQDAIAGSAPFEAGRYVIMRNEDRSSDLVWEDYRLDHNDGRVYRWDRRRGRNTPVAQVDHTYFTINAILHPEGTQPSGYSFDTFATFNTNLEQAMNERDAPLNTITTGLTEELARVRANQFSDDLSASWFAVATNAQLYSSYLAPDTEQCTLTPQATVDRDRAQLATYNAALAFREALSEYAVQRVDGEESEFILSTEARRGIQSNMVEFFSPLGDSATGDDADASRVATATLADPAEFDRVFPTPAAFANAVIAEAQSASEISDCRTLRINGKALPAEQANPAPG